MLPAVQLGSGKEGPGNATADASILDVIARSLFRRNRSGYVRLAFRSNFGSIGGNRGNEFEVDHRQHRALDDDHHPSDRR